MYRQPLIKQPSSSYDQCDKYYSATYDKFFARMYVSTTNYFWESNPL